MAPVRSGQRQSSQAAAQVHLNPGVGRGSGVIETGDVATHLTIVGSGGGYRGAGGWGGLVRVRDSGQGQGQDQG